MTKLPVFHPSVADNVHCFPISRCGFYNEDGERGSYHRTYAATWDGEAPSLRNRLGNLELWLN